MEPAPYAIRPCPPENERGEKEVLSPLTPEQAAREAARCLSLRSCDSCDLCRMLCPDLCITRDTESGRIEIDYDFCKGCGICAFVCPKGAIIMVREP